MLALSVVLAVAAGGVSRAFGFVSFLGGACVCARACVLASRRRDGEGSGG